MVDDSLVKEAKGLPKKRKINSCLVRAQHLKGKYKKLCQILMSKSLEWLMGKSNGHGGCCVVREKVQTKFAFLFRSLSTDFFPEDTDLFS